MFEKDIVLHIFMKIAGRDWIEGGLLEFKYLSLQISSNIFKYIQIYSNLVWLNKLYWRRIIGSYRGGKLNLRMHKTWKQSNFLQIS